MNVYEWILAGAVFVLWLRLEVLFHKHDVVESAHDLELAKIRINFLSWDSFSVFSKHIHDRLDKLDPPRRRATDRVGEDCDDICCKAPKKKAAKR